MPTRVDAAAFDHGIFISHASRDGEAARRIVDALAQRGLVCWISSRDIRPGADYQASIVAAIEAAPVMLLLVSRNAMASKEIPKETSIASELNHAIVPVLIDNAEITGALRYQVTNAQRLNLSVDFEAGLDHLAVELSHRLGSAAQTRLHLQRLALRRRLMTGLTWPLAIMLVFAGAAAVWHFQAQLHAWRDTFGSGDARVSQAATSVQPAPPVAATRPPPPPEDSTEARVKSFVERYYAVLSGPPSQLSSFLGQALMDPVQFYGRSMPRRVLVAEEIAYMQRWPDRSFVIRPDTIVVSCPSNQACLAAGVVDYTLRSSARHAESSGAETIDFRVVASSPPRLASLSTTPFGTRTQTQP